MKFEIEELIEIAKNINFFPVILNRCLDEIDSREIKTTEHAIVIIQKAESIFHKIESDLEMDGVFTKANDFLDYYGVRRALNVAGFQHSFQCNYKYMIANNIVGVKSTVNNENLEQWIQLRESFKRDRGVLPFNKKFLIPSRIIWAFALYFAGEDEAAFLQRDIDILLDYKEKLSSLYSFHSNPVFRTFSEIMITKNELNSPPDWGIKGSGVFSLDAIELEIKRLKAGLINKRKDGTLLERQLAANVIDVLYLSGCQRIPSAVSALMGGSFVKNILDDRTIFRLWKNYRESINAVSIINEEKNKVTSTVSFKRNSIHASRYEVLNEIACGFKSALDVS